MSEPERILLSHGGGGKRARELVEREFVSVFADDVLGELGDSAIVAGASRLAFTTDSFVVKPIFFPGGDIGRLAVCGTVNDLAVAGATPLYISLAMILEEGLLVEDLRRVVASVKTSADEARVRIVCGDTKVVEHGAADGMYLTTSGVGSIADDVDLSPGRIRAGDVVLVSGTLGDHAIAVMSAREGIEFRTEVRSDVQPLADLARALMSRAEVRCMRDPTRGGAAGVLNELAAAAGCAVELDEKSIPVTAGVRAACDVLGLDPLYAANEGKLIAIVSPDTADAALDTLRSHPRGRDAARIGTVHDDKPGRVTLRTTLGGRRIDDMPLGEQLPRIC
ncbi:MAG TPA: hydrogenase expression/formation protein HypE [Planctomycetota bacterium]|nr:hydrogenase expression/formation protein HypE [Planctomycetota bacterium]